MIIKNELYWKQVLELKNKNVLMIGEFPIVEHITNDLGLDVFSKLYSCPSSFANYFDYEDNIKTMFETASKFEECLVIHSMNLEYINTMLKSNCDFIVAIVCIENDIIKIKIYSKEDLYQKILIDHPHFDPRPVKSIYNQTELLIDYDEQED